MKISCLAMILSLGTASYVQADIMDPNATYLSVEDSAALWNALNRPVITYPHFGSRKSFASADGKFSVNCIKRGEDSYSCAIILKKADQ